MRCPHCGTDEDRVLDTRPAEDGALLRRRRLCTACGGRYTTHERVAQAPLLVIKKDGRREEFDPHKLRQGLAKACNKRPVAAAELEHIVDSIESELRTTGQAEINAEQIGEMVMERLFVTDQVAYVRFASVYQRFDDVARFAQLLARMNRRQRRARPPTPGSES